MKVKAILITSLSMIALFAGCRAQVEEAKPAYDTPLPPGQHALRKITDPAMIPDFTIACLNVADLQPAIANSLSYLSKPSSEGFFPSGQITHQMAVDSLETFSDMLDSGVRGSDLNAMIRARFDVYMSVGCDDRGTVLFTGYYTPIFNGSRERTDRFQYPLYLQPEDLVKGPNGEILGRRGYDGAVTPYPPRSVIESTGMMKGRELIWLEDRFEVYIAHVQGSAKIRLPDGSLVTVGYSASNGRPYRSVGQELVKDGLISSDQLSLSGMIQFFKQRPELVPQYVQRNPRYVFFRMEDGPPRGSLNEPVTPMRTIATDKSIFPRGCLTFISTQLPHAVGSVFVNDAYTGFALDQDTGGAIRAPGRCDVYMGVGELAGKRAGQTYQEGKLYYLFLKQ